MLDLDSEYIAFPGELPDIIWIRKRTINVGNGADLLCRGIWSVKDDDFDIESVGRLQEHSAQLTSAEEANDSIIHCGVGEERLLRSGGCRMMRN
jgi:hypothetical protein